MLNVFHRGPGGIRHVWGCELLYAPEDPGQDGRHVDFLWPVWGVLDVTPEGRGTDWNPEVVLRVTARVWSVASNMLAS